MRTGFICVIVLFVLTSCGYDDFESLSLGYDPTVNSNTNIATLREHYYDDNVVIKDDMVITGRVTANDSSGNFYKTFVLQDITGAVEIYAGLYDLHNIYRIGQQVTVYLKGCCMDMYNGVLRIGLEPDEWNGWLRPFGSRYLIDKYVFRDMNIQEPIPYKTTIDGLTPDMCGVLIKIDGVIHDDTVGNKWFYDDESSYSSIHVQRFVDSEKKEIYVATSRYADFADEEIPDSVLSLTGILQYGDFDYLSDSYVIVLRNENDIENH